MRINSPQHFPGPRPFCHPFLAVLLFLLAFASCDDASGNENLPETSADSIRVDCATFPPRIFQLKMPGTIGDQPVNVELAGKGGEIQGEIHFRATQRSAKLSGSLSDEGWMQLDARNASGPIGRIDAVMLDTFWIEGEWESVVSNGPEPFTIRRTAPDSSGLGFVTNVEYRCSDCIGKINMAIPQMADAPELNRALRLAFTRDHGIDCGQLAKMPNPEAAMIGLVVTDHNGLVSARAPWFFQIAGGQQVAFNFFRESGRYVTMDDLAADRAGIQKAIHAKITASGKRANAYEIATDHFIFTKSGIRWFDLFEGDKAETEVLLQWENLQGLINPEGPLAALMGS